MMNIIAAGLYKPGFDFDGQNYVIRAKVIAGPSAMLDRTVVLVLDAQESLFLRDAITNLLEKKQ